MISLTSFIVLAITFSNVALTLPLEKRTVGQVASDLTTINGDLDTVFADLFNLPETGANGLTALEFVNAKLIADFEQATNDVTATGNLDETDAETLLEDSTETAEELIEVLNLLVARKPTFEALSSQVPGLIQDVEGGLNQLDSTVTEFVNDLTNHSPPDVALKGAPIRSDIQAALATAIAAYAA